MYYVVTAVLIFREFLGNLTRGLYILNDDFHKESSTRYQDVHNLVIELGDVRVKMAALQAQVNQLLGIPSNSTTASPGVTQGPKPSSAPAIPQSCTGTGKL